MECRGLYDVMPDGKQLVVIVPATDAKPDQAESLQLRVALNAFTR